MLDFSLNLFVLIYKRKLLVRKKHFYFIDFSKSAGCYTFIFSPAKPLSAM